jgi:hypothetical protein
LLKLFAGNSNTSCNSFTRFETAFALTPYDRATERIDSFAEDRSPIANNKHAASKCPFRALNTRSNIDRIVSMKIKLSATDPLRPRPSATDTAATRNATPALNTSPSNPSNNRSANTSTSEAASTDS